jgi:hypothetical protein
MKRQKVHDHKQNNSEEKEKNENKSGQKSNSIT